jgi:hypothetical protein
MPLRNRVTPFGEIVATEARGTLFGNRGVLHDATGRLVRPWQVRRWIACRLEFRGRHRELLQPNRYTELFFLDEATALAAGHRPCGECRHQDYVRFRDLWARARPGTSTRADDIDRVLHEERVGRRREKRLHDADPANLPDGTMIEAEGNAWLVLGDSLMAWSPFGYGERRDRPARARVRLLTPPSIAAVIRHGYEPAIHHSAFDDER